LCRETKGKTLEEMAELFGDEVAFTEHISTVDHQDVETTGSVGSKESKVHHVEYKLSEK
jgi:hypothetical protein